MENSEYPYIDYQRDIYLPEEMIRKSQSFYEWLNKRRSVREFQASPFLKQY